MLLLLGSLVRGISFDKENVTEVLGLELPFSPPIHGTFSGYLVENTPPDVDKTIIGLARWCQVEAAGDDDVFDHFTPIMAQDSSPAGWPQSPLVLLAPQSCSGSFGFPLEPDLNS